MKKTLVLIGCSIIALTVLRANPPLLAEGPSHPTPVETDGPFDPRGIMDLIYASRPDSAMGLIEHYRKTDPGNPLVLLMRVRAARERLNDEDDDKELIRASTEPMHATLDSAIAICKEALEREEDDPELYFYRGYAWLNKAQLHVLTRSYWSAGREAGRGKKDLERYLEEVPGDPDAQGTLGAYAYFADVLPGFLKLVAKLLFIPTGNREEGIELLRRGAAKEGLFTEDWLVMLAAIDMIFEGNFEVGTDAFIGLCDRYPFYTRLVEPVGVVAPLYPFRLAEFEQLEEKVISQHLEVGEDIADWSLVKRMRLHRAFIDAYFGSVTDALGDFAALIEHPPDHPDWVAPIALLNSGYLFQKTGRINEARTAFETVRGNQRMKRYHGTADAMLRSLDGSVKTIELHDLESVRCLYTGKLDDAAEALDRYRETYGEDAFYDFYLGDLAVFEQDFSTAEKAFSRALHRTESGGDQIYQMFASLRLAELAGQQDRFGDAKDYLSRAKRYCHANYLLDFLIRSRKRYYDLQDDGKIDTRPTLLVRAGDRSTVPSAQTTR